MASTTAQSSLSVKTEIADGTTIDFTDARTRVSMVLVVTGTINDGIVAVESSHDGTNWVNHATMVASTGVNQFYSNSTGAFRYWRARIVRAVRGGGSISATFMEADR